MTTFKQKQKSNAKVNTSNEPTNNILKFLTSIAKNTVTSIVFLFKNNRGKTQIDNFYSWQYCDFTTTNNMVDSHCRLLSDSQTNKQTNMVGLTWGVFLFCIFLVLFLLACCYCKNYNIKYKINVRKKLFSRQLLRVERTSDFVYTKYMCVCVCV